MANTESPTGACVPQLVRRPSFERGCRDKIRLGHKGYANAAERMARKHGKRYAVYLCPHCGSTHLTTKLDGEYSTELLYVCKQPPKDHQPGGSGASGCSE